MNKTNKATKASNTAKENKDLESRINKITKANQKTSQTVNDLKQKLNNLTGTQELLIKELREEEQKKEFKELKEEALEEVRIMCTAVGAEMLAQNERFYEHLYEQLYHKLYDQYGDRIKKEQEEWSRISQYLEKHMAEEKKGLKRKLKNFLVIRLWKLYWAARKRKSVEKSEDIW